MEEVAIEAQAAAAAATDNDGDELDNLISELLNDDGLICALATNGFESCNNEAVLCSGAAADQRPATKRAFSSAYSGPTIRDIEMALSSRYPSARRYTSQYLFGACSRGAEINKHTTKVKSCGGKLPGDGYKWRKYGQKSIKKSPHPRSYYKCTISRCNAKKHVEKSTEDPDTLIVTYEGWHRHHPQPLFPRLQTALGFPLAGGADAACPVAKNKPKTLLSTARRSACDATETTGARTDGAMGGQKGLLEDVVPAVVRNPCDSTCSAPCPLMSPSSSSSNSSPANWLLDLPWSPGALLL